MKRILAVVAIIGFFTSVAFAGAVKTYQVTGPVLEVSKDMVAVQKGKDRGRSPSAPTPR
jgi:hypothetical protein